MSLKKYENLEVLLAPVIVLAFTGLLAVMYGWVGTMNSVGAETREVPEPAETRIVAGTAPALPPGDGLNIDTGIGGNMMQLRDVNGNIIPGGIGGNQGNIQLNQFAPMGIGLGQMQLTGEAPIPSGIGNDQMQLAAGMTSAYLGLEVADISGVMARQMGLPNNTGVMVHDVIPGSPAAKAGFAAGDIILKCDLRPVGSIDQMAKIISMMQPGEVVKFAVINHDNKRRSLHVKLSDGPTGIRQAAVKKAARSWLGLDVQNIDLVMKEQLGLADRNGVIVGYVFPDSPAGAAGIGVGDVLRRINGVHITDTGQFAKVLAGGNGAQPIELALIHQGRNSVIRVTPGRPPAEPGATPVIPKAEMLIEGSWIGMDVSELNPTEAKESGLPRGTRGIIVNDVESPPATMVGFMTGDCITAINSVPTPTIKQFVQATKGQSGAVVDILRGNRHMYVTVPPPGFTQQGTPMRQNTTGLNQVAMVKPAPEVVAVLVSGPDLNSPTGSEQWQSNLLLVNLRNNSYAITQVGQGEQLVDALHNNRVNTLICAGLSQQTAQMLTAHQIEVYTGVVGPALETVHLYKAGQLVALRLGG
ncbi:MAG: PDZ domain-containing protein [Desulfobulbaceae bacterium]|nr:PDZ domain-containing protein [Desulfobulbaceae bacterium]HIJ79398.1 PDZ domain-containing protein [Deltaproteobacteria bacterium]